MGSLKTCNALIKCKILYLSYSLQCNLKSIDQCSRCHVIQLIIIWTRDQKKEFCKYFRGPINISNGSYQTIRSSDFCIQNSSGSQGTPCLLSGRLQVRFLVQSTFAYLDLILVLTTSCFKVK